MTNLPVVVDVDVAVAVVSVLLSALVLIVLFKLKGAWTTNSAMLVARLDDNLKAHDRTERAVREELGLSRDGLAKASKDQRQELTSSFDTFGKSVVARMSDGTTAQKGQLDNFSVQLKSFADASGTRLDAARAEAALGAKQLREEVISTLERISATMTTTITDLTNTQKAQLVMFSDRLESFSKSSIERLDAARTESATGGKHLREEVVTTLTSISETMVTATKEAAAAETAQLETFSSQIASLTKTSGDKLDGIRTESASSAKQLPSALTRIDPPLLTKIDPPKVMPARG